MPDESSAVIVAEKEAVTEITEQEFFAVVSLEPDAVTVSFDDNPCSDAVVQEPESVVAEMQEQILIRSLTNIGDTYVTVAAIAISGHRVVGVNSEDKAEYVSCDNPADAFKAYGISTHAAEAGAEIEVLMSGEITEPAWNWNPGDPLFLGVNGFLTQTAPVSPEFYLIVGWAVTTTKMKIRIEEPLLGE